MIVDRKDYVQYMTVSKSHLDDCTCSLTEQKKALNDLYHDPMILYIAHHRLMQMLNKTRFKNSD